MSDPASQYEELSKLAAALRKSGQNEAAIDAYRQALRVKPDSLADHVGLASLLWKLQRFEQAVPAFREVIRLMPGHAESWCNLAYSLSMIGQSDQSIAAYQRAIALDPNYFQAHNNLGTLLSHAGRLDDAIAAYRNAIKSKSDYLPALNNLGNSLAQSGRIEEAIEILQRALRMHPESPEVHFSLGFTLAQSGKLDEAIFHYSHAVRLKEDFAKAWNNLGAALKDVGRLEEAVAACQKAIALDAKREDFHNNFASVLKANGQFDEAAEEYTQALQIKPDWAEAHWNLGLLLLLRGDFQRGWHEFEWRWRDDQFLKTHNQFPHPRWNGEPLNGKTILLHAEQGFGDTIQFIRYAANVATRGGRVLLLCPPEMSRLLRIAPGVTDICDSNSLPPFDVHCPLMSLARLFGDGAESIPAQIPYLHVPAPLLETWSKRIGLSDGRMRVGLAWAGRPTHKNDRFRSIAFSQLAPLAKISGITFYSLQKWPAPTQPGAGSSIEPIDLTADIQDFADTAALISQLDLVISVDTALAHLAGALGKPVWVLLTSVPDWRWMLGREDSPWYPTARLFRQTDDGGWTSVIGRVVQSLTVLTHSRANVANADSRSIRTPDQSAPSVRFPSPGTPGEGQGEGLLLQRGDKCPSPQPSPGVPAEGAGGPFATAPQVTHDSPDALNDRAISLAMKGQFQEAVPLLCAAIAGKPLSAEFHNNLANALKSTGALAQAIDAYREALRLKPNYAEAHSNLGVALAEDGDYKEAIASLRRAVALMPTNSQAYNNLGTVLADDEQTDEAIEAYQNALHLKPNYADAMSNLGNALNTRGNFDEALVLQQRALQLNSGAPEIHNNLGNVLLKLRRLDESIASYRHALRLRPGYIEAHKNLAIALAENEQPAAAIEMYRLGLRLAPVWAEGHWNLALTLLGQGQFEEGWKEFEWRWRWKKFPSPRRDFSQPLWDGSELHGRTILLHYEQGFGDTIQFIRYAPWVARRGARVIFLCKPELSRLLKNFDGIAEITTEIPAKFDVHSPLLSLPRIFETRMETIPAKVPYIKPDADLVRKWGQKLAELGRWPAALAPSPPYSGERAGVRGETSLNAAATPSDAPPLTPTLSPEYGGEGVRARPMRVGLVWAGVAKHQNDHNRSIQLSQLAPLSKATGVTFYSLQKGEPAAQCATPPPGMQLIDLTADLQDFADTAALITNLDLVITVDTAVAHLAGAMGKSVWVLLPANADWRWLCGREDSPWYPTMRLFRQEKLGEWTPVIERVAAALSDRVGSDRMVEKASNVGRALPAIASAGERCPPYTERPVGPAPRTASGSSAASTPRTVISPAGDSVRGADPTQTIQHIFQTAVTHHTAGRIAEAVTLYQQILSREPNHVDAMHLLGVAKALMGEQQAAITLIERAIALHPTVPEFYRNLANAWGELKQFDKAIPILLAALRLRPDYVAAINSLGIALIETGKLDEAISAFEQIFKLQPSFAEAYYHHGNALTQLGRLPDAANSYRQAIRLAPNFAEPHNGLAIILSEQRHVDEALTEFGKAIALKPSLASAHCNLGNFLVGLGRVEEGIASIRRAEEIDPQSPTVHCALGVAFKDQGWLDDAVDACRRAIQIDPQCVRAHSNLGMILLLRGDFENGWRENEWRWKLKDFGPSRRNFRQPRWDGTPLNGKRILLYAEQGFGDTLQFMRYIPMVAARGGRVIFECHTELARLLQGMENCELVVNGQRLPDFDVECPLMSLPFVFNTRLQTIPPPIPVLRPNPDLAQVWEKRLPATSGRLRVGLAWAGNPQHGRDATRSLKLEQLAPLFQNADVTFVSLQKDARSTSQPFTRAALNLIDFTTDLQDFADTAALMSHLDLVISVDTAVAHLGGAMRKPVWLLLPSTPDWRWMLDREDSPWYPTMKLFRQHSRGDWKSVIDRVAKALKSLNQK